MTARETLAKAADLAAKARDALDEARRLLKQGPLCARAAVLYDEANKLRKMIERQIET